MNPKPSHKIFAPLDTLMLNKHSFYLLQILSAFLLVYYSHYFFVIIISFLNFCTTSFSIWTVSEWRWDGTDFGRPCWSVHGSGRMWPASGGSRSRPSDMKSGKLAKQDRQPRVLEVQGLLPGVWGPPILGECRRSPTHFRVTRRVWATALTLDALKTKPCATLVRSVWRTTNTDFIYHGMEKKD